MGTANPAATYSPCPACARLNRVALAAAASKQPVCGHCGTELAFHDGVSEVNAAGLAALVAKSPVPVVVDFWAPWCGPCRAFAPTFLRAAGQLAGGMVFAKLDTERHPQGAAPYGIRGIPTLILFQDGRERARQSGALPLPAFLQWVATAAGGQAA